MWTGLLKMHQPSVANMSLGGGRRSTAALIARHAQLIRVFMLAAVTQMPMRVIHHQARVPSGVTVGSNNQLLIRVQASRTGAAVLILFAPGSKLSLLGGGWRL
ncbi:hypothetical protein OH492_27305 [Vibrio chagasii]|nr:hypothetical protein [Vibrio chagasii]